MQCLTMRCRPIARDSRGVQYSRIRSRRKRHENSPSRSIPALSGRDQSFCSRGRRWVRRARRAHSCVRCCAENAKIGISPRDRFSVKTATAKCLAPVVRPRNSVGFAPTYPRGDPQSFVGVVGVGPTRHLEGWVLKVTLYYPGQGTDEQYHQR